MNIMFEVYVCNISKYLTIIYFWLYLTLDLKGLPWHFTLHYVQLYARHTRAKYKLPITTGS